MKIKLLLLLFALAGLQAFAQISYEKRLEFELKDGYSNEEIIAFGSDGFIMMSKNDNPGDGKSEWKFELFDQDLKSVETKNVKLNKRYVSQQTYNTKTMLHTFLRDRKGNYALVSLQPSNMEVTKVEGAIPKKSYVTDMVVLGEYAYFTARIKNAVHFFSINWKSGKRNILRVNIEKYSGKKTSLMGFQVLENANEVLLFSSVAVNKKKSDVYMIRFEEGSMKEMFNISKSIKNNISNITASKLSDGSYIFTGTYSANFKHESEGMFVCKMQGNKISYAKFYNFLDLKKFLSYLPQKQQAKIQKKKARKADRGKDLAINYYIAAHDIMPVSDGFIFLGEAYYPTYRTETRTTYVNGVATTTTYVVFDGYQYTHAFLAKFDDNGSIVWDQTFKMYPYYKPFFVKKFITVSDLKDDEIKMVFSNNNRIVSKSIDFDGKVVKERESEEIKTSYENDKTRYSFSNIDFWYDSYFLAYGSQKIKNTGDKEVKKKRLVFFVQKINFE